MSAEEAPRLCLGSLELFRVLKFPQVLQASFNEQVLEINDSESRISDPHLKGKTGQGLDLVMPAVTMHTPAEGVHWQMLDHLREDSFAYIHMPLSPTHEFGGEAGAKPV